MCKKNAVGLRVMSTYIVISYTKKNQIQNIITKELPCNKNTYTLRNFNTEK